MTEYANLMTAVENLRQKAIDRQLMLDRSDWLVANAHKYPEGSDPNALGREMEAFETARRSQLIIHFASLPEKFKPWSELPSPATFGSLAGTLATALPKLVFGPDARQDLRRDEDRDGVPDPLTQEGPGSKKPNVIEGDNSYKGHGSLSAWIPEWTGIAAMTFETEFAPKIPGVVGNEFSAVQGLRGPLLGAEELYKKTREDVCKMVDTTTAKVEAAGSASGGELTASLFLSLVAALGAAVSAPLTGGSSAVLAINILTSAALVGSSTAAIAERKVTIKGDNPIDLVADLISGLTTLNNALIHQEKRLEKSLQDLSNQLQGIRQPNPDKPERSVSVPGEAASFTMPRPALADVKGDDLLSSGGVGTMPK